MILRPLLSVLAACLAPLSIAAEPSPAAPVPPKPPAIRALLITGGCCHDYPTQTKLLTTAVEKLAAVEWTIVNDGGTGTRAELALYDNPRWAEPYDIIVHNACFADTTSPEHIRKITTAHRVGKPALVIHCAMHTYRAAQIDDWREFLGVTSHRHDHESRYLVRPVAPAHPALKDFPDTWLTPRDELYIIEKHWPTATTLAVSTSEKDGKDYPVIWINDYHGTRVFGTTFGHGNATWEDPVFQTLLARGLLWAAGREE
jgi:type 1 glutamine amidotransferase